jgi:hypothetical protein
MDLMNNNNGGWGGGEIMCGYCVIQVFKKYFINENVSKCYSLEGNFH